MPKIKTESVIPDEGFSLISNHKLLALYSAMVGCRRIAGRTRNKGTGSLLGHEAAAVGAAIDLTAHDTVASHWPQPALQAINSIVSIAPSVASATRFARLGKKAHCVTLLFSSSTAGAQNPWLNALAQAIEHNMPIIFVQPGPVGEGAATPDLEALAARRRRYALPFINVDGKDVVAVFRVASEAIIHARKGHGPTLIYCRECDSGDPIETMEKYLSGRGLSPH